MNRYISVKLMAVAGFVFIALFGARVLLLQGQAPATAQYVQRAIPAEKGGQDVYGPYEVVADWPKPLTSLTGDPKWRWGVSQGIFAESPNRVFMINKGQIPELKRPAQQPVP